jgi:hypothetical protein
MFSSRFTSRAFKIVVIFLLCNSCCIVLWLLPSGAEIVHETHFYLGAGLRMNSWLNANVGNVLHAVLHWVDKFGTNRTHYQVDVALFQRWCDERKYDELASLCFDAMHRLYPIENHNAFYHGIADSWAAFVVMILQCSVQNCSTSGDTRYDLQSFTLKNTNAWRGLAGNI